MYKHPWNLYIMERNNLNKNIENQKNIYAKIDFYYNPNMKDYTVDYFDRCTNG